MLSVTYFYREPRKTGVSIEGIFKSVEACLKNKINIKEFYCDANVSRGKNTANAGKVTSEINHITGDVNFLAMGLKSGKTILTIHDLGHYETLRKKSLLQHTLYKIFWFWLPLRKVAIVTVISQFTKDNFLKYFSFPEHRIRVIYDPVKTVFRFSKKEKINAKPRILHIGTSPHKNLNNLIEAANGLDVHLDIIAAITDDNRRKLADYNIAYTLYDRLTDEELYQQYIDCDILYFASFYEGFGMPIIEAQAVGRPVITSHTGAMKEVAGDSACLVDPYNVAQIRKAITDLSGNMSLYEDMVARGRNNIKKFDCETIANEYLAVYKELANG